LLMAGQPAAEQHGGRQECRVERDKPDRFPQQADHHYPTKEVATPAADGQPEGPAGAAGGAGPKIPGPGPGGQEANPTARTGRGGEWERNQPWRIGQQPAERPRPLPSPATALAGPTLPAARPRRRVFRPCRQPLAVAEEMWGAALARRTPKRTAPPRLQ